VTYTPLRRITSLYMPSQRPIVGGGGGMRGRRWRLGTRRRTEQLCFCERLGWESLGTSGDFYLVFLRWAALLPSGPLRVFGLLSSATTRMGPIRPTTSL
jgi:hypothetical protein